MVDASRQGGFFPEVGLYDENYAFLGLLGLAERPPLYRNHDGSLVQNKLPHPAFRFYATDYPTRLVGQLTRVASTNQPYDPAQFLFLSLHPRLRRKDEKHKASLIERIAAGESLDTLMQDTAFSRVRHWDMAFHAPIPYNTDGGELPLYLVRFRRGAVSVLYVSSAWEEFLPTEQLIRMPDQGWIFHLSIFETSDPARAVLRNLRSGVTFKEVADNMLAYLKEWQITLRQGHLQPPLSVPDDEFPFTVETFSSGFRSN